MAGRGEALDRHRGHGQANDEPSSFPRTSGPVVVLL
jgi:hypothetical protein